MAKQFGALLREIREQANVSMGALARHLEVSVPYLSDVERGFRPPLVDAKIVRAAALLNLDLPDALLKSAAEARGAFQLDAAHASAPARQVGAMLARQWPLSEAKLEKIRKVLEED